MADYLAESRQCHQQMLEGRGWRRRRKEAGVAMFIGQIRCTLSLEAVKAHARLQQLLGRLRGPGAGVEVAARRRIWAEAEKRRLLRERKAHPLCQR